MGLPRLALAAAAGYLLGTVPSADVAARLASGGTVDLRDQGTGNPGAVNAMVVLGARWGYGVLAADVSKGALACAVGRRLAGGRGAHLAGTSSVVGHCFPVWKGFRGGKGVGCSIGQCLMTFPAWVPVDLTLAAATSTRRWTASRRTHTATIVASLAWVGGAVVWWRKRWPNAWGPPATGDLPLFAALSASVILHRFLTAPAAADPAADPAVDPGAGPA